MSPKTGHPVSGAGSTWVRYSGPVFFALSWASFGFWLNDPTPGRALLAGGIAVVFFGVAARRGDSVKTIAGFLLTVCGITAILASNKIHAVESDWEAERESLLRSASELLNAQLGESIAIVEDLVSAATQRNGRDRREVFESLREMTDASEFETGIVVYGVDGNPRAWSGRFRRVPSTTSGITTEISPGFAVLEMGLDTNSTRATASLVLWADSSLPDVGETVAKKFRRATGSGLRFFLPQDAPDISDVFDFCLPDCDPAVGTADTLFSVRAIPPSQGSEKLRLLSQGGQRVSWLLVVLLFAMLFAPLTYKRISVAAFSILLIFTPAGSYLGMERIFSSATFFVEELGPFSNSVGDLIVTAAFVLVVVVGMWRLRLDRNIFTFVASIVLIAAAPYALRIVAHGITPTGESEGPFLWLSWELGVTLTSSALIVISAAMVRGKSTDAPAWMSWLAIGLAVFNAVLGVLIWEPGPNTAWPEWYTFLWIPALLLAVQPASTARLVSTVAIVAGSASALLTWGAGVEGQMVLARRDIATLGDATDIAALSALEAIAEETAVGAPPESQADLYEIWAGSNLKAERYPVAMAMWDAEGAELVRFDLALLDSMSPGVGDAIESTRATGEYEIGDVRLPLGRYSVLAVPFPDGRVLSVVVGPKSMLVPTARIWERLGFGTGNSPVRLSIRDNSLDSDPLDAVRWQREGWEAVGARRLLSPGGDQRVVAEISLVGFGRIMVRGALVVLFDLFVVVLLWILGEVLAGRVEILPMVRGWLTLSAYRTRLLVALAVFFVIPTFGFAGWSLLKLQGDLRLDNERVVAQRLSDVSRVLRPDALGRYDTSVGDATERFGADVSLYRDGVLVETANEMFTDLGLVDPLVPDRAFVDLVFGGADEAVLATGRPGTVAAFRSLPGVEAGLYVIGMDGAAPLPGSRTPQGDVILTVLLVSLLGVGAAMWLASVTAGSMTKPLRSLRDAAGAVGQGQPAPPIQRPIPAELDSVVEAFERMTRDVNEHQHALESTVRFTQAVLRHVATGVIAMNRSLEVETANPRAEALLVTTLATGTPIKNQTSPSWSAVWDWVARFVEGESESDVKEFTVDARRIKVLVATLEGGDKGCVAVLDDVTDLTRAERVLAWGEVARQVAHEIKNPLTPMRLGIQHLQRAHRDKRADFGMMLDQTSGQILTEIERLDSIARGFSQFGSPARPSEPAEPVEICEIAREAAELYAMSGDRNVIVTGEPKICSPVLKDEFKQVLVNLIENSNDANATAVTIEISKFEGSVLVKVIDDGDGVPPAVLPRIFEPSFSTTTSGTGLGLAICKRLVESWGGGISVDSVVNSGTTVTMSLPCCDI